MLGKADDRDIVVVSSAVDDTRAVFETDLLEPFLVKGKTEPITAAKVRGLTGHVRRDSAGTRLVGRQKELDVLTHAIGELDTVVELVGTAGVGKSRLLDAAWSAAEGLTIYQGACTPYGAAVPYSVYRPLLRSGSGIPVDASAELTGNRLTDIVAEYAPELLPMLPLIALPFGAKVASTPEADAIDPEFRRLRIHDVVVDFLDATLNGPILLVVEDAHWIDDASGDLTNHLVFASSDRPWAGIITRRPEGSWEIPEADHVVSLHLEPLDDEAIRQLAIEVSTRPLADRDLDLVAARAQGNPLFAVELAKALSDADTGGAELPDTIEQIIASRFDRLDPAARRLIRVASVLGNLFHEVIVSALFSAVDRTADVSAALAAAEAAGAITPRAGSRWGFSHALYRDTAYEGLPFRQRQQFHRLAAEIIEERAADGQAVASLLSLHYSAARVHERAWKYSLIAADAAEAQNATAEAAAAMERALSSGRYCRTVTRSQRARVAEQLGDHEYTLARFDGADARYRLARRIGDDAIADVGLMRKIGLVRERQGRPSAAISWFRRAGQTIPSDATTEWASTRAELALAEAGLRSRRGENRECKRLALTAYELSIEAGDRAAQALALERAHLALVFERQTDSERFGPRALDAHRELEDQAGMARTLINLGIGAYFDGDWSRASSSYLEAAELAERSGGVVLAATGTMNGAEILSDQGHWQRAISLLGSAKRNYQAVGYAPGVAAATLFGGVAKMRDGQLSVAEAEFDEVRTALEQLQMTEWLHDLQSRELELHTLSGTASTADADALLDRFGPGHGFEVRVRRTRANIRSLEGDDPAGANELRDLLSLASCTGFERGLCILALSRLERAAMSEQWSEVGDIFRTLGVVNPPPQVPSDLEPERRPSAGT